MQYRFSRYGKLALQVPTFQSQTLLKSILHRGIVFGIGLGQHGLAVDFILVETEVEVIDGFPARVHHSSLGQKLTELREQETTGRSEDYTHERQTRHLSF